MRSLFVFALLPALAAAQVTVREEKLSIPTWEIGPAQIHPVFADSARQNIYPYTYNDTLTNNKVDKAYNAVWLENEYIQVLVLPDIGGRMHGGLDKTNGYVWMYWQKTIKPGLISMTGAWISGGIEWNYPHGHRPSGFMPVDHRVVRNADGSATVWVGETEPIYRVRWLVGMTVFPGRSYMRCEYVLVNPTDHRQPFQFWATAATHANENTQAQYPGDMVTGHGKHEFWNWPIHNGVDLTWWKNSPNASSYFAFNNPSDWFGTYDHGARGGTVHVASHYTMPGKKLWTWGSGPSGRIWEDILTEGGGPYFEPQAGGWSDNQPDCHWMHPHEVRRTEDYWYPVRDTRGFNMADKDFALNTDLKGGMAFGGVYSTGVVKGCRVVLKDARRGQVLSQSVQTISPDKPYTVEVKVPAATSVYDLHLSVYDAAGKLRIELQRQPPRKVELPEGQRDPGDPRKMSLDELYHAGEWLDRYTRTQEALVYYEEALRRDPKDSRVNVEMGFLKLKLGLWEQGLKHLETALARDADNGRIYYGLGLGLAGQGKFDQAYDNFQRAAWSFDYRAAAQLNLARLELRRGRWREAADSARAAALVNGGFADIPALEAAAWRHAGQPRKALALAGKALELDAMNFMGGHEKLLALRKLADPAAAGWEKEWASIMRKEPQNYMELAVAYGGAGLFADADAVLGLSPPHPMGAYLRAWFAGQAGKPVELPRASSVERVLPHRLEEMQALRAALDKNPKDARAHLFLGNLLYSKWFREEGLNHWREAVRLDSSLFHAWRNIAYAERFLKKDLASSYQTYRRALELNPGDARVLLEMDQVAESLKQSAAQRFALLDKYPDTVQRRDDLMARMIDLRIQAGDPANLKRAYQELRGHHFHSWEGRYGIHESWVDVNQRLGDLAFSKGDYKAALDHYQQACEYPKNLEVAARTPDFRAHVFWNLAKLHLATGQKDTAHDYLKRILAEKYGRPHLGTFYQALAEKALGNQAGYRALLDKLESRARELAAGSFRYRGNPQAVGQYLLSRVLEEKGDAGAAEARDKALALSPEAPRLAIREAQLDYARAHQ